MGRDECGGRGKHKQVGASASGGAGGERKQGRGERERVGTSVSG